MNIKKYKRPVFWLLLLIGLSSCDHNRRSTGWEYFDDMAHSAAYESYTPNPTFADGKTMQATVEGTIPRGFMPYPYAKTDDDRVKAGENLKNPFEVNDKNRERGKKVFTIYCSACHGDLGDGKGRLYTSGKYPFPPASLLSDKIRNNPEGEIYHVISVGFGVMAEHGSMIKPDDRWKVAMYIKNNLHQQY